MTNRLLPLHCRSAFLIPSFLKKGSVKTMLICFIFLLSQASVCFSQTFRLPSGDRIAHRDAEMVKTWSRNFANSQVKVEEKDHPEKIIRDLLHEEGYSAGAIQIVDFDPKIDSGDFIDLWAIFVPVGKSVGNTKELPGAPFKMISLVQLLFTRSKELETEGGVVVILLMTQDGVVEVLLIEEE